MVREGLNNVRNSEYRMWNAVIMHKREINWNSLTEINFTEAVMSVRVINPVLSKKAVGNHINFADVRSHSLDSNQTYPE